MFIARKHRLNTRESRHVFKNGLTVNGGFFFLKFIKNDLKYCQVAAIVPSKIFNSSVKRNRLKRIIYSVIDPIIESNTLSNGRLDIALIATPSIVGKTETEIKAKVSKTVNIIFSQMGRKK